MAASSDSFKAMFYGDFNREKDVTIPDASPNGFRALLWYIYTDGAGISEDNVDSLIRLSDKYLLHELFAECVAWTKENVNASNVCRFLPVAELYTELSEPCLRVIVESSSEVLASEAFRGLSLKLACQVLSMDRLRVHEVVVWETAIAWTSEHLESIDRPVNDTEIRRAMGDLVHTVRYPLMSRIEFVERVASRGILTTEEKLDLLLYYDTARVPEGVMSAPREGVSDLVQFRTRHCVSCGHQSDVPLESECPSCSRKHVTVIECGEHDRAFILGDDAWDFVSCAGYSSVGIELPLDVSYVNPDNDVELALVSMQLSASGRLFHPYPAWLMNFYDAQAYIVSGASAVCCTTLIVVVLQYTPRKMGALKWYIIASSASSLICELLMGMLHPIPLTPYPLVLAAGGTFKLVNPSTTAFHMYINVIFISAFTMLYCNAAMFAFRFLQAVGSKRIRLMAQPKTGIAIAVVVISFFAAGFMIPLNFVWVSEVETMHYAEKWDADLFELIRDRPFVGLQVSLSWPFLILSAFIVVTLACASFVLMSSAVGCQYFVRSSSRPDLSERTLRLYQVLANTLVIDLALNVLMFFLPMVGACASFMRAHESSWSLAILCMIFGSCYPIATNVVILTYVTPYRRGLMRMLRMASASSSTIPVESRIK
ncbi:BTB/POZ domain-containing protein 3-like protein [Aphelenchoides avenae]|nr:BTB/POZ domain-containing protein 3-like protein [Aphelenchus avenae]